MSDLIFRINVGGNATIFCINVGGNATIFCINIGGNDILYKCRRQCNEYRLCKRCDSAYTVIMRTMFHRNEHLGAPILRLNKYHERLSPTRIVPRLTIMNDCVSREI